MSEESISQSQTKIEAAKQELRDSIAKRGQATSIKDFIPGLILTLLLVASVVGGCYFFSLTGITIQMFLTINEFALFNTMLGLNFIYFILLSSLSLALIMALGRKYIFKFSLIFGFVGYIIGAVVGIFLFNLLDFTFPILCLLIGIPLGTKYLAKKEEESKYMPLLRSGASAAGRIITIFAILFMLMLFFITIQTKDTLKENFVPEMLKMTIGGDGNISFGKQLSGQLSESISTAQITMLTQILADPAAVALKAKTSDTEGQVFIQTIEAYKAGYGSKEFKDKIAAQMKDQKAPIADQLLQKFEMMGTLSELAWVIYPFAALFMILLIGGLFVRTITAIIYTILAKALRVNIA